MCVPQSLRRQHTGQARRSERLVRFRHDLGARSAVRRTCLLRRFQRFDGPHLAAARTMDPSPRALVHQLVASRLLVDEASIRDTDLFDDLGLTLLDVVLVVLRLDRLDRGDGEFPVDALEHATKVGDLVDLVELWVQRDTMPTSLAQGSGL